MQRDEVLARLRERILTFAASHISRDVAEDLAQEVLMLLHEKYPHLETPEELLPLSLQIVRFKIMSLRRKAVRRGEYNQVSVTEVPLPDREAGTPRRSTGWNERRCWTASRKPWDNWASAAGNCCG